MNKAKIVEFFDNCAPWWDDDMIRNEPVIQTILDNAGIREGVHVLDVACGTGVLFPDYLQRGAASVTAIDISPEMAKIAAGKSDKVNVICGDVETTSFDRKFDCIMVYNAFPHFPDPRRLIRVLARLLPVGGKLSVAHGMSRQALLDHHAGRAASVSIDLLHESDLAAIFSEWFDVDVVISDAHMYQVCGIRKEADAESAEENENAELCALLRYMISHNDSHAQELAQLAQDLRTAGNDAAFRQIMEAVAEFDSGNARLQSVLKDIEQ